MRVSPSSTYRIAGRIVICLVLTGNIVFAQYGKRAMVSKGPRALGLIQLTASGKAHLIPICIMVDGKFYDATIYKANPVPMALDSETVYEGVSTGESLGLFTVQRALQGGTHWIGDGKWQAAGAAPEKSTAQKAETKPREEEEGPPVLRRPRSEPRRPEGKASPPDVPPGAPAAPAAPPVAASPQEDSDRPRLRRESSGHPKQTPAEAVPHAASTASHTPSQPAIQIIPAVSDAGGPEPRSYRYEMKPDEEQAFRSKMLTLAASEVLKRAEEINPEISGAPPARSASGRTRKGSALAPQPTFDNVQLRVFDVSASNEPVIVLTAKAQVATPAKTGSLPPRDYYLTLVGRTDLYGELKKLYSTVTDVHHLDVTPRMELLDAVDADGDGRGELLFREISDVGSAFVVYRVGADQLWQLFEGARSALISSSSEPPKP